MRSVRTAARRSGCQGQLLASCRDDLAPSRDAAAPGSSSLMPPQIPGPGSPAVSVLDIPVVWAEECLRHEPGGEVWLGVREQGTEVPERAEVILAAVRAAGGARAAAPPR